MERGPSLPALGSTPSQRDMLPTLLYWLRMMLRPLKPCWLCTGLTTHRLSIGVRRVACCDDCYLTVQRVQDRTFTRVHRA